MAPGLLESNKCHDWNTIIRSNKQKINEDACISSDRWPTRISTKLAWEGSDFLKKEDYTIILSPSEVHEVELALKHFHGLELDGDEVDRSTFPLPTLGPKLEQLARDIHSGKGFGCVSGLDPVYYSSEDNVIIFLGISSYIGEKRGVQSDQGEMLIHILEAADQSTGDRPTRYNHAACKFHTDAFCDIVAMQVRNQAASGGSHSIASSAKVYNSLVESRPDLISSLSKPDWPFDIRGRLHQESKRPVLYHHKNKIIINYGRTALEGLKHIPRPKGLPYLSPKQTEALDAIQSLATQHQLTLAMDPGDITFINNFAVLHSRESYVNTSRRTRHLVRLWLKNEDLAWSLPRPLQIGNDIIYLDNDDIQKTWNIHPAPKLCYEVREILSDA